MDFSRGHRFEPFLRSALLLVLWVPFLTQCTNRSSTEISAIFGPSNGASGHGTGYNGAAPKELVQRCGVNSANTQNEYRVECSFFKTDLDGKETAVTELAAGVNVTWLPVKVIGGTAPTTSPTCSVSQNGLNQSCAISLASASPVTLQFDSSITSTNPSENRTLSDTVMLPYFVQTLGFNPKAGRNFYSSGESSIPNLQPVSLNPLRVRLQRPQVCAVKQGMLIADNDVVYLWNAGDKNAEPTLRVFVGSIWTQLSLSPVSLWEDRFRLPLQSPIAIDCRQEAGSADYSLFILSTLPGDAGGSKFALTTVSSGKTTTQLISSNRPWASPPIRSLQVAADGHWYFTDDRSTAIYRINPKLGNSPSSFEVFAGSATAGDTVEGVLRQNATFRRLQSLVVSSSSEMYVADMLQHKIFFIDRSGAVHTAVGDGTLGTKFEPGQPKATQLYFPMALALSGTRVFIGDSTTSRVLVYDGESKTLAQVDGISSPRAELNSKSTQNLALGWDGSIWAVYAQDSGDFFSRIARFSWKAPASSVEGFEWVAGVTRTAADPLSNSTASSNLQNQIFTQVSDAAIDTRDNSIVLAEAGNYRLLRAELEAAGGAKMAAIAGQPFAMVSQDSPDGTLAASASIQSPVGVAVAANGAIYFTESSGRAVKKIDTQGKLQTVADLSSIGAAGPAASTQILYGIAILSEQTTFALEDGSMATVDLPTLAVADNLSQKVHKLTPTSSTGNYVVSPLVSVSLLNGVLPAGFNPSIQAFLPNLLKTDSNGNLFIGSNIGIFRYDSKGKITRIAGGGDSLDPSFEGPALGTNLNPRGMFVTGDGTIYVSDTTLLRVVKLVPLSENSYQLILLSQANRSIQTCGVGSLSGQGESREIGSLLGATLSQFCLGQPQAIVVLDRCQTTARDFTLLFSQSLSLGSKNSLLVRATRACQ